MSVDMVGLACAEGPADNVWWISIAGTDGMEILRFRLNDTGPTVRFAAPDTAVRDLAFDGVRVWAACADGTLYGLSETGEVEQAIGGLVPDAWGLAWSNGHLWVSCPGVDSVYEIDPAAGIEEGSEAWGERIEGRMPSIMGATELARLDCRVLDITGRDVTGQNEVARPGVYFLGDEGGELVDEQERTAVRKVIVR